MAEAAAVMLQLVGGGCPRPEPEEGELRRGEEVAGIRARHRHHRPLHLEAEEEGRQEGLGLLLPHAGGIDGGSMGSQDSHLRQQRRQQHGRPHGTHCVHARSKPWGPRRHWCAVGGWRSWWWRATIGQRLGRRERACEQGRRPPQLLQAWRRQGTQRECWWWGCLLLLVVLLLLLLCRLACVRGAPLLQLLQL